MATTFMARNFSSTTQPTQLTTNVDNNVNTTNIPVQSTAGYPPAPFTGCIERNTPAQEFVLVTSVPDANHFLVVRGYDGTSPATHNAPATFEHCVGAIDYREANQHHTNTALDDHTQYLLTNGSRASTGYQAFPYGIQANYLTVSNNYGSNVQTRYMGGTAGPGPPGGGSFLAGDWIVDTIGVRWTCIAAGSPGTWVPESGRIVLHYQNTGSLADQANNTVTVNCGTFLCAKGVSYVIDASYQGTIITAIPNYANGVLYTSPSIFSYNSYIHTTNTSTANVLGNVISGSTTAATNAPAANTNVAVMVNLTSSGSGGIRTLAGGLEVTVRRA